MDLKPVNSINNDANTIRVSDGNSPIRLIFKDAKGEVINLYDKIDYFYLTKDDEKFYSVTDISYDGDEVIIRLPKLRKGQYKAEIRDKDGSIYPANEDLYILLRRSFEDDKDIYYFGHREDILNNVEPIIIQHIEQNPDKFRGERGQQGFPGRDGLPGIDGKDGKDGKDGEKGDPGKDGSMSFVDLTPEEKEELRGERGRPGLDGKDGIDGKDGLPGKDGRDGIDGMDGKDGIDGIDGKDGSIGNVSIGIINLLDFEKLYAYDNTGKIDNIDIENGIINYSSIAYYIKNDKYLKKGTHSFRVLNYTSHSDYSNGNIGLIIRDVVTKEVLYNITVEKNINYSFDILEEKEYSIELRIAGVSRKTGFIEKPMLVEGDIPVLWNYEKNYITNINKFEYKIPTDFISIQECFNYLKKQLITQNVNVIIESGYKISSSTVIENVVFSGVTLSSEDDTVYLSSNFNENLNLFTLKNVYGFNFNILIDAEGKGNIGINVLDGSLIKIDSGCGVINSGLDGLNVREGSTALAVGSKFTGASQKNLHGAGITAWGGKVIANNADVSGSNYYGARSAHGGTLVFDSGKADNCSRHGIRSSQQGRLSARYSSAKNCSVHGIYALDASIIHADKSDVSGCLQTGFFADGSSTIECLSSIANNCSRGISAERGSFINAQSIEANNCKSRGMFCSGGSSINARNGNFNDSESYGVECVENSNINMQNSSVKNSKSRGLEVDGCSNINAPVSNISNTGGVNTSAFGVVVKGMSRVNLSSSIVSNNGGRDVVINNGSTINLNNTYTTTRTDVREPNINDVNASNFNVLTSFGTIFK